MRPETQKPECCWWCDAPATPRRKLTKSLRTGAMFHLSCLREHNAEDLSASPPAPREAWRKSAPPRAKEADALTRARKATSAEKAA